MVIDSLPQGDAHILPFVLPFKPLSAGFKMIRFAPILAIFLVSLAGPAQACIDLAPADAASLSLTQALARVADCHPEVRAARAALAGAAADVLIASQAPNPQLTVGAGSVGHALGSGSLWRKTFDHSVRLDQLFERAGKPMLRRSAAEAARSAARAEVADARRRAASAVAHAHQDLWAAQGRRAQLEAAVSLSAESLRLLDQRVRAGDAPVLDATRFRLDDARLQADLRQSVADSQDLQRQLALLIGAPGLAVQLQAQASDQPWVMPDGTGVANVALEGRADVVAAMARVSATASLRDLAVAARTRDLNIGLQFDHWPTGPGNNSGTGDTVSVSVSVPLFVRHANEGEVARAEADLAAAQEALRKVRDTAAIDWARAEGQARAAGDRRRLVVEQLEPAAEKVAAGAELAYRRGASTALELLDARRSLRVVRLERINADAELAKALVDWRVAAVPSDLSLNP